ncbi:hypothetical protein ABZW18_01705 [Streptomyces sp. NPDC004647]|uniref:hypothetical protein n=1 Tax=Streptomyces sp. NPDC004647 TaxID=3154671 RepID=UPI0033BE5F80
MTALHLADARETADLAAFLARLLHYDRRAAVRLQSGGGVLAVFGRPASFEVLAIRTARLAAGVAPGRPEGPGGPGPLDVTVSAGQLADALDAALAAAPSAAVPQGVDPAVAGPQRADAPPAGSSAADAPTTEPTSASTVESTTAPTAESITAPMAESTTASMGVSAGASTPASASASTSAKSTGGLAVTVPEPVTGPPWAGMLPPRGGWQRVEGLPGPEDVRRVVSTAVSEFRARTEALPEEHRTRAQLDRIGREIWSRTLGGTDLPLRAVHAAQSLGFLRRLPAEAAVSCASSPALGRGNGAAGVATTVLAPTPAESPVLLAAGGWLRLRTSYGSIAVRRAGLPGLAVTPV